MPFTRTLSEKPTPVEVREALLEAGHYFAGLRARPAADRGEGYEGDVRTSAQFIRDADLILMALERGAPAPDPGTGILGGPQAATTMGLGFRTPGVMVSEDAGYRQFAAEKRSSASFHEVEIPDSLFMNNSAFRATITSNETDSTGGSVFVPTGQPLPPRPRQMRMFLRDLINVQGTNLASIPYIREVNPTASEYGASAVAENTAKPEVAMDWTQDDAPVRKIAAWVPVTTEIIEDAPTLQGYIDARLAYLLAVREEFEILNGSGAAPHLKGILQYAELQTQAFISGDPIATLGVSIGKIENVDGEADGIAMNPLNYWSMITTRYATNFDGDFGRNGPGLPFGNAQNIGAWGLPVVRSRAVAFNTAVVAAWVLGATLFDKKRTTIRVGNQHSDYFTNNKVAVLAEERVALAVHRPDFFVRATIG